MSNTKHTDTYLHAEDVPTPTREVDKQRFWRQIRKINKKKKTKKGKLK